MRWIVHITRMAGPRKPWAFRICNGTETPICPEEHHGHLYRPDGEIGLLYPALCTKTQALVELRALKELSGIETLEYNQNISAMEEEISQCDLPE